VGLPGPPHRREAVGECLVEDTRLPGLAVDAVVVSVENLQLTAFDRLTRGDTSATQEPDQRPFDGLVRRLDVEDLGPEIEAPTEPGCDTSTSLALALVNKHKVAIPADRAARNGRHLGSIRPRPPSPTATDMPESSDLSATVGYCL
jgi:hypothetical protein